MVGFRNLVGTGIAPVSKKAAVKCCGFGSCGFLPDLKKRTSQRPGVLNRINGLIDF